MPSRPPQTLTMQVQRDWVLAEATYRKALGIYTTLLDYAVSRA